MTNATLIWVRKHKGTLIVAVGCLLAALALGLVLRLGPAEAAPGDPCVDCGGGGGTNTPPTVTVNAASYNVNEGGSVSLGGTYNDPDGNTVNVSVDADNNGTYESVAAGGGSSSGTWSYTFSAGEKDGPGSQTVNIKATDSIGDFATTSTTVNIMNVAPFASFNAPSSVNEGSSISLSLTNVFDPSLADRNAGFTYAFDCGSGYGAFTFTNSVSCSTNDSGTRTVKGRVRDKDGGTSEYTRNVTINNVHPQATFNAPTPVNEGSAINLSLTDVVEPSLADRNAGFTYAFDCGSGFGAFSPSNTANCPTTDNGSVTVKGQVRDKDGGTSPEYTKTVTINNVAPEATFDAPNSASAGGNFTVSFTNPSDPSSVDTAAGFTYAFDCHGDGTFEQSGSSSTATCTAGGLGTQTVKGRISDKDNGSNPYEDTVSVVDDTNPTGSVVINGGATYTKSATVTLTLSADDPPPGSGVASMRFSHDGQFWSEWENYANSKSLTLPSGDGTKTIHVQYRDKAGNISTIARDSITLDTTKPTISRMSPKHESTITNTKPTIKATVKDNNALTKANIKLFVNGDLIAARKYTYDQSTGALVYKSPALAPGKKTVKIVVTDAAKNVGKKSWYFTIK